jgi:hypothetical protein
MSHGPSDPAPPVRDDPPTARPADQGGGRRLEIWAALALTAAAVLLHLIRFTHAGALWRDEAAVVQLATLPSLAEVFRRFPHEAFPPPFPFTIRALAGLAGNSDHTFRLFGLFVGLLILAAAWATLWLTRRRAPLLSLALLGFNAAFIQWTDSLRGYGLGTCFIVLTAGLVWRAVEKPGASRVLLATLSAITSVQFLLHNPTLLLAICVGAAVAAVVRESMSKAVLPLAVGAVAAISLVPYWAPLRHGREWDTLVRTPVGLSALIHKLSRPLGASGESNVVIWVLLFGAAIAFCFFGLLRFPLPFPSKSPPIQGEAGEGNRPLLTFAGIALLLGAAGYCSFLWILSYPTHEWYYVALMGFVAVLVDCVAASLHGRAARGARLVLAIVIAATSFPLAWSQVRTRQTNVDQVAAVLRQKVNPGDFVVVCPWFYGISFGRYYLGPAPWMTVPEIGFSKFHRFDLIQAQMARPDPTEPVRPVLDAIRETLQRGNRVWVVGTLDASEPAVRSGSQRVEPDKRLAEVNARQLAWSTTVATSLRQCALHVQSVPVPADGPVSKYETLRLQCYEGWAEDPKQGAQNR